MKRLFFLLLLILSHILNGQVVFPYQIKSGKIEYTFSTGFQKGTKTLIFTDSGRIERMTGVRYVDSTGTGISKESIGERKIFHWLTIQTRDSVFSVDLDLMTGTRQHRDNMDMSSLLNEQLTKNGQTTFLDKQCNIMDFHGLTLLYWQGIVLKKELPKPDNERVYEYATLIDENYLITTDDFKVPTNVIWRR